MPAVVDRPAPPPTRNLLRIQTLRKRFDVRSPNTIRNWIRDADFPKPILIGNLKYWLEHEVEAWVAARPRRAGAMPVEALRARGIRIEDHAAKPTKPRSVKVVKHVVGKRAAHADATAATGSKRRGRIGFTRG